MNELKRWGINIIVILFVCAALKYLIPQGSIKKTADTVLTLLVFILMLSPLADSDIKSIYIHFPQSDYTQTDYVNTGNEYLVEKVVSQKLNDEGIEYDNLEIIGETDSEGVYCIDEIRIDIEEKDIDRFYEAMEQLDMERGIFRIEKG